MRVLTFLCAIASLLSLDAQDTATVRVMSGGSVVFPGCAATLVPFLRTGNWKVNSIPVGLKDSDVKSG
jgi:hypothetical protein